MFLEKLFGKKEEGYGLVGRIEDYDFEEIENTRGRPYMEGVVPKIGYSIDNYQVSEKKLFGDKEKVLLTDEEYKEIMRKSIENPGQPVAIKEHEKTIGEYLEEKGIEVEIELKDREGNTLLTPYRSGEKVEDVAAAKKLLYGDQKIFHEKNKDIKVAGNNSKMFLKAFLHTEPESYEEFENKRIFYKDLEFL